MTPNFLTLTMASALLTIGSPIIAAETTPPKHEHGHDHGKVVSIGSVDIGTYKAAVLASERFAAGKEWDVEIQLNADQPTPKAVRVWVGLETGRGSVKAKLDAAKEPKGAYNGHVTIPDPIPAESKIWIAIEPESGETGKASLSLPKAKAETKAETKPENKTKPESKPHDHAH